MARGAVAASVQTRREETTRLLFTQLAEARTAADRAELATQIATLNLPLCDALAARYLGRGVDFDDLVQVARTALWMAIRRYQPADDRSFLSFAVPTITGELKRYFRDHCWSIRPPRRLQELGALADATREGLEREVGRSVTTEELGRKLGVDPREVAECQTARAGYRAVSLDAATGDDGPTLESYLASGDDIAEDLATRLSLRKAVSELSPRDQQVLAWRFDEECTQSEIAARLGLSQMQVSRILRRILDETKVRLDPDLLAG